MTRAANPLRGSYQWKSTVNVCWLAFDELLNAVIRDLMSLDIDFVDCALYSLKFPLFVSWKYREFDF